MANILYNHHISIIAQERLESSLALAPLALKISTSIIFFVENTCCDYPGRVVVRNAHNVSTLAIKYVVQAQLPSHAFHSTTSSMTFTLQHHRAYPRYKSHSQQFMFIYINKSRAWIPSHISIKYNHIITHISTIPLRAKIRKSLTLAAFLITSLLSLLEQYLKRNTISAKFPGKAGGVTNGPT